MLIKPYKYFESATDISADYLKSIGVTALMLDVDNTLTLRKGSVILEGVPDWLKKMQNEGIKLIILSNSKPKRMERVSKNLGLPFVAYGMKPITVGYFKAAKRMGVKRKECAIVGDQLFTDMLGGNLAGVKTILVSPKELETTFLFKVKRGLERPLLKHYKIPCSF